ncbi:unnamed protein product [Heterosigma akashiwo]|uniref:Protein ENHANCED DISEASE RESISTANCE 2 C-terminal domain-containing protein n=1 Tax=Heterosigma akashiwo TaxID=2829 RepID=A0A6S9LM18_HETAK|mmetsp:Transcript_39970/g.69969  ORF Transcript_39970/g.69969 Transcript_39970/m.69969 type:complete len:373 (+) Transcript_39970:130-1248(+)
MNLCCSSSAGQVRRSEEWKAEASPLEQWFYDLPEATKQNIYDQQTKKSTSPTTGFRGTEEKVEEAAAEKAPNSGGDSLTPSQNGILPPVSDAGTVEAGSTFPRNGEDEEHSWEPSPADMFRVRQPGYSSTGQKAPSGPAFYETLRVDTFRTPERREGRLVPRTLRPCPHTVESGHPDVPSVFVVNCQIPNIDGAVVHSPFNKNPEYDGPCFQIVFHFGITEQTRDWLRQLQEEGAAAAVPPALRLWALWCREAPASFERRAQFKAMAMVDNPEELNLPGLVLRYNGKPALITNSGTLSRGGPSLLQMDINVHRFAYLARKGLDMVKEKLEQGRIRVGFTVESREEEHLPEQMLGVCFFKKYKRNKAPLFHDL